MATNLTDYVEKIEVNIRLTRNFGRNGSAAWVADLDGLEAQVGHGFISYYGEGDEPDEAIEKMVEQIRGKKLVRNPFGNEFDRKEYPVPENLIYKISS